VNAKAEYSFLKNGISSMIDSRISTSPDIDSADVTKDILSTISDTEPVTQETAVQAGKALPAEYVVYGNVTIVGERASLDTKVVRTDRNDHPMVFSRQIDTIQDIIPAAGSVADEIREAILQQGGRTGRSFFSGAGTPATTINRLEIDDQITGLCTGDIDHDGKEEIVVISDHDVSVFHVQEDQFVSVTEYTGESHHRYLSVDVADLNQNGMAEIYISCEHSGSGSLESFVLEWDGKQLAPILQGQGWYFRINHTEKGNRLFGQQKGISTPYTEAIYPLSWKDKMLVPGEKEAVPENIMVFGFVTKEADDVHTASAIAFDSNDRLCFIDANGGILWKGDTSYGGREAFIKSIVDQDQTSGGRYYLPQRIIPLADQKKYMIVVPWNESSSGRLFQKFRRYTRSCFAALALDEAGLSIEGKSKQLSGYISDFCIADINNDGRQEMVYALVTDRGMLFRSGKSYITSDNLESLFPGRR
jgi:TolB-like protein